MMTIGNALQRTFGGIKNYKGEIGLEIETESKDAYDVPKFSFWVPHVDNSLRNFGQEYVLRQPLMYKDELPKALDEFDEKLKHIKFLDKSITTSVHVHMNFLNENFITLGNFFTIYTFVENLLVRFSGEDRLSNLFCLPICDAEETYYNIIRMLQGIKTRNYIRLQFAPEDTKYAALNLSSLARFGSLELRSFRGTIDTKLIYLWVGILYDLMVFSRTSGLVPPMIIKLFKEKNLDFLNDVFGKHRILLKVPNEKELIEKNFWYATNIAYAIKEWESLEKVERKNPNLKDLDKISMRVYGTPFETLPTDAAQNVLVTAETELEREETRHTEPGVTRDAVAATVAGTGLNAATLAWDTIRPINRTTQRPPVTPVNFRVDPPEEPEPEVDDDFEVDLDDIEEEN